jgi:hypothetical protein
LLIKAIAIATIKPRRDATHKPIMSFHRKVETEVIFSYNGANIMSKSKDTKKAVKKEPAKTPKEKKEAKKVKKEAMKRQ